MGFIYKLRGESNYPTFRLLAQVLVGLVYLAGLIGVVVSLSGGIGMAAIAGAVLAVCLVVAHALYEAAMMMADVADAAVRMADNQEQQAAPAAANLEWNTPPTVGVESR